MLFGLDRECLGEECLGAVILLKVWDRSFLVTFKMPITILPVVTARLPPGTTGDVDVKAKIVGELRGLIVRSKMRFADEDRAIAGGLESARQGPRSVLKAGPVPIRRAKRSPVVALRANPLGDAVASRVLSAEDGSASWRSDTHGVEVVEPCPLGR